LRLSTRSVVIDRLQQLPKDGSTGVAFIYCKYKEQTLQTVTHLIASLLKQLVQDCPVISDNVKSFYRSHQNEGTYPTLDEFTKALAEEVKIYTKFFIIVDALDECAESNGSRIKLLKALRSLPRLVNLMVTSRDLPSIEEQFPDARRLRIRASDNDVANYVQSQLVDYPSLINLRDTIIKKVVDNAKGM
jgi:hypothetical protein